MNGVFDASLQVLSFHAFQLQIHLKFVVCYWLENWNKYKKFAQKAFKNKRI